MVNAEFDYEDIPEEAKEPLEQIMQQFFDDSATPVVRVVKGLVDIKKMLPMELHSAVVLHILMILAARVAYSYFKSSTRANGLLDDTFVNATAMEKEIHRAVAAIMEAAEQQAEDNLQAAKSRRDGVPKLIPWKEQAMLILSRKKGETICITQGSVTVRITVIENNRSAVRMVIEAPKEILIRREELCDDRGTEPDTVR